ncbi:hypothetical protein PMm318_A42460 [Pseudomonas moorei]
MADKLTKHRAKAELLKSVPWEMKKAINVNPLHDSDTPMTPFLENKLTDMRITATYKTATAIWMDVRVSMMKMTLASVIAPNLCSRAGEAKGWGFSTATVGSIEIFISINRPAEFSVITDECSEHP